MRSQAVARWEADRAEGAPEQGSRPAVKVPDRLVVGARAIRRVAAFDLGTPEQMQVEPSGPEVSALQVGLRTIAVQAARALEGGAPAAVAVGGSQMAEGA